MKNKNAVAYSPGVVSGGSIGWDVIDWVEANLLDRDGLPLLLASDQKEFLVNFYRVKRHGDFKRRNATLIASPWDEMPAILACVELVGPARCAGRTGHGAGEPKPQANERAWVITTRPELLSAITARLSDKCRAKHRIEAGQSVIFAEGRTRRAELINSASLEGALPTMILADSGVKESLMKELSRAAVKTPWARCRLVTIHHV